MMKQFINCIFQILVVLVVVSCSSNQNNQKYYEEIKSSLGIEQTKRLNVNSEGLAIIDLEPFLGDVSYDFDTIVEEMRLIPLETNSNSILGPIRKILATDSFIYVYDEFKQGGLAIFDRDGAFIKRLPNGKGPGELDRIYDIDFNKATNELIVYKHSFLVFYSDKGEFIKEERVPFGLKNFKVLPHGYAFYALFDQNFHLDKWNNAQLLVTDKTYRIKYAGLWDPKYACLGSQDYLHYGGEGNFYITQKCVDTIFEYSPLKNSLEAKYFLKYKNKIPDEVLKEDFRTFQLAARDNDYYFTYGSFFDNGKFQVFVLSSYYRGKTIVVYRDKNSGRMIGGSGIRFNLNQVPPVHLPLSVMDGYFISCYYPGDEDLFAFNSTKISEKDKMKVRGLDKNSNPVLIFYSLNENRL